MGNDRNIEFRDLHLLEAGVSPAEMAAADAICQRVDDVSLRTEDAALLVRWNPLVPGLNERLMAGLEERLCFELGFGTALLEKDESLDYPGAVLIGIDPGPDLGPEVLESMGKVIVAIASHYLKASGSSIE